MAVLSVTSQPAPQVTSARDPPGGANHRHQLRLPDRDRTTRVGAQSGGAGADLLGRRLFQFIDQTWLSIVKAVGPALGFGAYAQAIQQGADGRYQVTDRAARDGILNLRNDPAASATMWPACPRLPGRYGRRLKDRLRIAAF